MSASKAIAAYVPRADLSVTSAVDLAVAMVQFDRLVTTPAGQFILEQFFGHRYTQLIGCSIREANEKESRTKRLTVEERKAKAKAAERRRFLARHRSKVREVEELNRKYRT